MAEKYKAISDLLIHIRRRERNSAKKFARFKNLLYLCSMNARRDKQKQQANQLNKQLEPIQIKVKEKNDDLIQLGKFFYSLAGMTYAGAILTIIIGKEYYNSTEILWSVLLFFALTMLAWITVRRGNIKR